MDDKLNDVVVKISAAENDLREVQSPDTITPGTVDVDGEMYKLMINISILPKLKLWASEIAIAKEQEYSKARLSETIALTPQIMKDKDITRSERTNYVKMLTCDILYEVDKMKAKARYFDDMLRTYSEWLMVYKKTRDYR